ncbi:MAG: c-type cytochrome [Candidatus Binatia bacterium]
MKWSREAEGAGRKAQSAWRKENGGMRKAKGVRSKAQSAWRLALSALPSALCVLLVVACRQQMADQPRHEPLQESGFFADGRSARPLVPGTVARGQLRGDEHFYTGKVAGKPADRFPFRVTAEVLDRGQERFHIFCSPCHDRTGGGQGMVVRRGFRPPPSFHSTRLRRAPAGELFGHITSGIGAMPSYAAQIPPRDRWAIVAYVRALQLSQQAGLGDVPAEKRPTLQDSKP